MTPLWPQVVILDFFDTFSSSSRRWRHQFMLSVSVLLPDFRRAGCVAARTGVGVTCRGARRALFCVDGGVYLVKLLSYQAHTGLIHTLGCLGQATRPRQALCVHAVERHAPLTRRHTTLTPGSLADYSTRIFRRGSRHRSASETAALILRGVLLGSSSSHLQPHGQALSSSR